jgi:hypothetical protein
MMTRQLTVERDTTLEKYKPNRTWTFPVKAFRRPDEEKLVHACNK